MGCRSRDGDPRSEIGDRRGSEEAIVLRSRSPVLPSLISDLRSPISEGALLPTLLRHLVWADRRTAASIATLDAPSADLVRVWAHLLAAEATWLARIEGRAPDVAVWPELTLEECRTLMERNHGAFTHFAAASPPELAREVSYRTSRGAEFRNTVTEILTHVAMHGMYHRGQVALEVRRAGGEPQATDLVFHLREGD